MGGRGGEKREIEGGGRRREGEERRREERWAGEGDGERRER